MDLEVDFNKYQKEILNFQPEAILKVVHGGENETKQKITSYGADGRSYYSGYVSSKNSNMLCIMFRYPTHNFMWQGTLTLKKITTLSKGKIEGIFRSIILDLSTRKIISSNISL